MKKMMMLALALMMMLTLTGAALAESAPMNKEDQMKNMVQGFLDENGYEYEYDDYTFSMSFALENALEYVNVMVFVDDDMLSVTVDAPIQGEEAAFEPLAVLTTLINSEIFYAQFRVDHYNDKLYVACRACNLAEDVVPGENELYYLINEPMRYMEEYGDGIYAVIGGGDPYEAFEACQAAVNE